MPVIAILAMVGAIVVFIVANKSSVVEKQPSDREITAEDVAWAIEHRIWKFDFKNEMGARSATLLMLNNDGTIKITGPSIQLVQASALYQIRLAIKRDGNDAIAKLSVNGSTVNRLFTGAFSNSSSAFLESPSINGTDYLFYADSTSVGTGPNPFDPDSTVVAIRFE